MPARPSLVLLVAWVASVLLFVPAHGQSDSSYLERLNSPDYAVRNDATRALLADPTINLDTLARWFQLATTHEQRRRLLDVIRHQTIQHFRLALPTNRKDPALGISHDIRPMPQLHEAADAPAAFVVFVTAPLPGFPGYAHLQAGDLITAVNGENFPLDMTNDSFKQRLRERQAGDTIRLTVVRDGETLHMSITLGAMEALERMYTQASSQQEPFRSRWESQRMQLLQHAPPAPVLSIPAAE